MFLNIDSPQLPAIVVHAFLNNIQPRPFLSLLTPFARPRDKSLTDPIRRLITIDAQPRPTVSLWYSIGYLRAYAASKDGQVGARMMTTNI